MGASHSNVLLKRFNSEQLILLKKFFQDISSRNNKDNLDKDMFLRVFKLPGMLGERLFDVFDSKGDSKIDLNEFLSGLSIIVHGTIDEKINFLFQMYDLNGDGKVKADELSTMLFCAVYGSKIFINGEVIEENEFENFSESEKNQKYVNNLVEKAFKNLERDYLNFEDFKKFILNNLHLLEILEDAFIFEDYSDEEKIPTNSEEESFEIIGGSNSLIQKTFKLFLKNKCHRENCYFGGIITPDTVKERHKKLIKMKQERMESIDKPSFKTERQKTNRRSSSLVRAISNISQQELDDFVTLPTKEKDDFSLNLSHAFEHMHHFHHDANIKGSLYKLGKSLHLLVKRYLILRDSFLYIFRHKDQLRPLKAIWMEGCVVEISESKNKIDKQCWPIQISFPSDTKNRYTKTFYAYSQEQQIKWYQALKKASDSHDFYTYYKIKKEIGAGKFSTVYSCKHRKTKKEFAVKVINKRNMNEREKEALRLEISIMKLVHHPNVVQIFRVYENKNTVYIVMQLFKKGDLFDKIKKNGCLSESEAKAIMWRLFDVCKYIHSLGIIHRDLKPENIMIDESGHIEKIAVGDFGLSAFIGPEDLCDTPCGTLSYVAPEVFLGKGYGKEIDIWSLGVLMFVLIRGALPFKGNDKYSVINSVLSQKLKFSEHFWDDISENAKEMIRSLLKVDPKERMTLSEAIKHPWFNEKHSNCI